MTGAILLSIRVKLFYKGYHFFYLFTFYYYIYLFCFLFLLCMCGMCVYMHPQACSHKPLPTCGSLGTFVGVSFLLLPWGSRGVPSGRQAWQQTASVTEGPLQTHNEYNSSEDSSAGYLPAIYLCHSHFVGCNICVLFLFIGTHSLYETMCFMCHFPTWYHVFWSY